MLTNTHNQKNPTINYGALIKIILFLILDEDDFELVDWRYNLEFIDFEFWSKIEDAYFVHVNGCRPIHYRVDLLERIAQGNYEYFPQPEIDHQEMFRPFWRETC